MIPIYYATIDGDGTEMSVISLVESPATEVEWQLFSATPQNFKIENQEERLVLGLVMAAETPIYRRDDVRGEYYLKFSRETIAKMVQQYFKDGYQERVDTDHNFHLIDGIELQQAFIKDTEKGITPTGFENVPDGSLFFAYKVVDDELWNQIKNGTWTGFSLAGSFELNAADEEDKEYDEVMSLVEKLEALLK